MSEIELLEWAGWITILDHHLKNVTFKESEKSTKLRGHYPEKKTVESSLWYILIFKSSPNNQAETIIGTHIVRFCEETKDKFLEAQTVIVITVTTSVKFYFKLNNYQMYMDTLIRTQALCVDSEFRCRL